VLSVLGLGVLAVLVVALVASIWWDLPLV